MSLHARLAKLEAAAAMMPNERTKAALLTIDAQVFRDELRSVVKRQQLSILGDTQTLTNGELLAMLGLPDDNDGWLQFRIENRPFLQVLKHNRGLPHICSEFCCASDADFLPKTDEERAYFVDDVLFHLEVFKRHGWNPETTAAVGLYRFCQNNSRKILPAVASVLNEMELASELVGVSK